MGMQLERWNIGQNFSVVHSQILKSNPVNWTYCFCMTRLEVEGRLVVTGWEFSLRSSQGNHF